MMSGTTGSVQRNVNISALFGTDRAFTYYVHAYNLLANPKKIAIFNNTIFAESGPEEQRDAAWKNFVANFFTGTPFCEHTRRNSPSCRVPRPTHPSVCVCACVRVFAQPTSEEKPPSTKTFRSRRKASWPHRSDHGHQAARGSLEAEGSRQRQQQQRGRGGAAGIWRF